jgi:hypothetical protein
MKSALIRTLTHGALVVASIITGLLLFEGLLRVFDVSYPVFDDFDEARGFRLRPGKQGWYRAEGEAYLSINSLGYRDREHDRVKPENTVRIAILGDSFVEARQVALEDTFWHRLSAELQACDAFDGKHIEALSFGVGGYNTSQEYITLEKDVFGFSPDIVLLAMFLGNDIAENSKNIRERAGWRFPSPTHSLVDGELVLDTSFQNFAMRQLLYSLTHYSRAFELANEVRRTLRARSWQSSEQGDIEAGLSAYVYLPPQSESWRHAWHITDVLLASMNNLTRRHGAEFIVTTIPSSTQVDPNNERRERFESLLGVEDLFYPDERISRSGLKSGFAVYPLAQELQKISERQGLYLHGFPNTRRGLGHLNEKGHELVAQLLSTKLCRSTDPEEVSGNQKEATTAFSAR